MNSLQIKKTNISWDWKESVARWTQEKIFDDLQKDESTIFIMAKDDVARILQKTNFKFVVQSLDFDEIYKIAFDKLIKQLKKQKINQSGKLYDASIDCNCMIFIQKIISRIANNIKNTFDERYLDSIKVYQINNEYFSMSDNDTSNAAEYFGLHDDQDALNILIKEEDQLEYDLLIAKLDKEYIDTIASIVKIQQNQMQLDFGASESSGEKHLTQAKKVTFKSTSITPGVQSRLFNDQ